MLISEPYRLEMERRYIDPQYGTWVVAHAPLVSEIVNRLKVSELLDYRCGRAHLVRNLDVLHELKIQCYDPSIPGFAGDAIPMQMVACVDVLQDVEPDCIDAVLDDLQRVTGVVGYFSWRYGEEAPRIEQDLAWWLDKIMTRFELHSFQARENGFHMIVYAQPKPLIDTVTVQ